MCSIYNGCWPELVYDDVNGWTFDPLDLDVGGDIDSTYDFSKFVKLTGGNVNDTFDLSALTSNPAIAIDGNGGILSINILKGPPASTYNITGYDTGNINGVTTFTDMQQRKS